MRTYQAFSFVEIATQSPSAGGADPGLYVWWPERKEKVRVLGHSKHLDPKTSNLLVTWAEAFEGQSDLSLDGNDSLLIEVNLERSTWLRASVIEQDQSRTYEDSWPEVSDLASTEHPNAWRQAGDDLLTQPVGLTYPYAENFGQTCREVDHRGSTGEPWQGDDVHDPGFVSDFSSADAFWEHVEGLESGDTLLIDAPASFVSMIQQYFASS